MIRYEIEFDDGTILDVNVAADTDFDDRFPAICNDTGERLHINGWMAIRIEQMPDYASGALRSGHLD